MAQGEGMFGRSQLDMILQKLRDEIGFFVSEAHFLLIETKQSYKEQGGRTKKPTTLEFREPKELGVWHRLFIARVYFEEKHGL